MKKIPLNIWVFNIDALWNTIDDYRFYTLFLSDDEFIQLVYDAVGSDINGGLNVYDYIYNWFFKDEINGLPNRWDIPIDCINKLIQCVYRYYEWISIWDTYLIYILSTYEECKVTMVDKSTVIVRY